MRLVRSSARCNTCCAPKQRSATFKWLSDSRAAAAEAVAPAGILPACSIWNSIRKKINTRPGNARAAALRPSSGRRISTRLCRSYSSWRVGNRSSRSSRRIRSKQQDVRTALAAGDVAAAEAEELLQEDGAARPAAATAAEGSARPTGSARTAGSTRSTGPTGVSKVSRTRARQSGQSGQSGQQSGQQARGQQSGGQQGGQQAGQQGGQRGNQQMQQAVDRLKQALDDMRQAQQSAQQVIPTARRLRPMQSRGGAFERSHEDDERHAHAAGRVAA